MARPGCARLTKLGDAGRQVGDNGRTQGHAYEVTGYRDTFSRPGLSVTAGEWSRSLARMEQAPSLASFPQSSNTRHVNIS